MRWILVWWVINPGHPQVLHIERGFPTREACVSYYHALPIHLPARWRCSEE
jgi:hypothetical protein